MTGRSWLVWLAIGAVLGLLYVPLVPPLFFSLAPETAAEHAPTLRWYLEMWRNPLLTSAVLTSFEAAAMVAVATPLLALAAAISIRELSTPRLILGLMLLPLLVPGVSMGIATAFFFKQIGVAPSLATIVTVQILWALPFAVLVVLAAMSTFDPVLTEAAHVSGAGRWRAFRDIELPLIWPGVSGAATFSFILSFNETIRTALVQGPLNTVQTYIWSTYKQIGLSPTLYALMTLLIFLTLALSTIAAAIRRR